MKPGRWIGATALVVMFCAVFVWWKKDDLLLVASGSGERWVIRALLALGADPNVQDSYHMNALMFAALQDNGDAAELLLRHGAKTENGDARGLTPLFYAGNRTKILGVLLEHGANPNARSVAGETPLLCAIQYNLPDVAIMLIQHGANVDMPDNGGRTPLMVASYEGQEEIFHLLVSHHANLRAKDLRGWTALKCARTRRQFKLVRVLEHRLASTK